MQNETGQFDSTRLRPMSEGLGLNHFADGLPYTPAQARRRPMVQFNYPPPRSPRASTAIDSLVAPTPVTAVTAEEIRHEPQRELETAGMTRRVLAYAVDLWLLTSIFGLIVWGGFSLNGFNVVELVLGTVGGQLLWPMCLLYFVVYMSYFLIQETTWRTTLGKSMFGIAIRANSGAAVLGRALCFPFAIAPAGLGLFWFFLDRRHRCWHDSITDTDVVCE